MNSTTVYQTSGATPSGNLTIPTWDEIRTRWIASEIFAILMFCVTCYTTLAMLCCGICGLRSKSKGSNYLRFGPILHALCLIDGLCNLLFQAIQFAMFGTLHEPFCYYYEKVLVVTFGLGTMSTYAILWLRMLTAFYMNPSISSIISKKLKFFAFGTFPVVMIMMSIYMAIFFVVPPYATFEKGCLKVGTFGSAILRFAIVGVTTVIGQSVFLFYLVYPLYMHRRNMLSSGINESSIIPLVKKLTILFGICISVTLACYLGIIIYTTRYTYFKHTLLGVIMLVHLFTAYIQSFPMWKTYIFPCYSPVSTANNSTQGNTGITSGATEKNHTSPKINGRV